MTDFQQEMVFFNHNCGLLRGMVEHIPLMGESRKRKNMQTDYTGLPTRT